MTIRNQPKENLIDFILSMMSEEEANEAYTDWATSPEQVKKLIDSMKEVS